MELRELPQWDQGDISRRSVIRKAAYAAPVVFAIAAAPNVALGKSGNKNNNGFGNGPESGSAPGNSGSNGNQNSGGKESNNGR